MVDAASGAPTLGIADDVTAEKQEGHVDGCVSTLAVPPAEDPLDRTVDAALAAHAAILALGPSSRRSLLPTVELLLHELGRQAAKEG